jgi:LysM repeat protein
MNARIGWVLALVMLSTACAAATNGAGPGTTQPVVRENVYPTLPTTPTTVPLTTIPGQVNGPQTYVIQQGDTSRMKVASRFGVTVEALDAANAATPGYSSFFPGLEIIIPATAVTTSSSLPPAVTVLPVDTEPLLCPPKTYVIEEGDTSRVKVADKLGTTAEGLDEANLDTPGYAAFYPGLEINVPQPSGC